MTAMKNNSELLNILKAELTLLSKDILQHIHKDDINALYKSSRKLYEKITVIKQLSNHLSQKDLAVLIKEAEKESVVPGNNPVQHIQSNVEPKVKQEEEIENDNTSEPNQKKDLHRVYQDVSNMKFVEKKKEESGQTKTPDAPVTVSSKVKKMSIGLNDKISFINHLFDKDADAYAFYIDKLNEFNSYEEALQYIQNTIKPKYARWEGKDEYEFRLLQLLELKFN